MQMINLGEEECLIFSTKKFLLYLLIIRGNEMKLNEDKILVEPVTEKTVGGIVIPGVR